jgi:hypothetical protein
MREPLKRRNFETRLRTAVNEVSPPIATLPPAPHVARRCCEHWITQQYTTLLSPACKIRGFYERLKAVLSYSVRKLVVRNQIQSSDRSQLSK